MTFSFLFNLKFETNINTQTRIQTQRYQFKGLLKTYIKIYKTLIYNYLISNLKDIKDAYIVQLFNVFLLITTCKRLWI